MTFFAKILYRLELVEFLCERDLTVGVTEIITFSNQVPQVDRYLPSV